MIDTSGFLCINDDQEIPHEKAAMLYKSSIYRVRTNYVLREYVALANVRGMPHGEIIMFSTEILNDDKLEIV